MQQTSSWDIDDEFWILKFQVVGVLLLTTVDYDHFWNYLKKQEQSRVRFYKSICLNVNGKKNADNFWLTFLLIIADRLCRLNLFKGKNKEKIEAHSEPCPNLLFAKSSVLNVWQGSEYASAKENLHNISLKINFNKQLKPRRKITVTTQV